MIGYWVASQTGDPNGGGPAWPVHTSGHHDRMTVGAEFNAAAGATIAARSGASRYSTIRHTNARRLR
jgi:hypothetical protein